MDKIIVPVDFSSASSWGFYYAYDMAKSIGADLVVVHLYWPPYVESTYPIDMIQSIINEKEQEVLKHLKAATRAPLNEDGKVEISYVVRPGSENTIVSVAEENEADLIIMGTHGSGKALDKVWGTNTANVIQHASCPVLAIPTGATFEGVKNIAYATDFDDKDNELLFQLALITTAIKANLHCIHINPSDYPYKQKEEEAFRKSFEENFADLPVTYSVWSASTIEDGLETFCRVNKIDILAMLTHKKTLWDKIFTGGSVTKKMTMQTNLPLLAFHK
ncbi:universal stress protein [Aureispira anguillae]|uniref:Universal stress protein n=1 Tax=Aureispira anguillae TaxID=2864201 RepID=A0A915YEL2_9BACT|nr:universal stress protein [Aureispira anguillae]BDS11705.1 universal stress protein [Aureispira anguillae]